MKDFTVAQYQLLLDALIKQGYSFQRFDAFLKNPGQRSIVLRHDVDLLPYNSLAFAKLQAQKGVKGVYYFRAVPESWNENVIKQIAALGHEIGYHYECLTTCKGNVDAALADFEKNLAALRQLAPVSTICMHGSPMSRYDSKDLWKKADYKTYGIIGEPYFDVDFTKVFYLTDTGRRWDGEKVSVRDKVKGSFDLSFHTTPQLIAATNRKQLPEQVMFTFHPQRWNDSGWLWLKELLAQNLKNSIKKYFFVKR